MTDCKFCGNPINDNSNIMGIHSVCDKLYWKRYDNNICTHCGKKPKTRLPFYCIDCDIDSPYSDYPGPQ